MNTESKGEILSKAINRYGCLEQCLQAMEEAGELVQAINKLRRLGGITKDSIDSPCGNHSDKYIQAYDNLCGEVADMKIMIAQFEVMLDPKFVQLKEERKLARLQEQLNK